MKHSTFITIWCSLVISSCNTNQPAQNPQGDSLQQHAKQKDSTGEASKQDLQKSGDMVKAESPDALTEYEHGYALPKKNEGDSQSPVDIISTGLLTHSSHKTDLKFTGSINAVDNLGHTIQVDFAQGSATMFNGKPYELKQLHFHTPSEHLIDGMTFPMEMHIVSKLNDSVKEGSAYTVLGILFRIGRENKFLHEFLGSVPHEEGRDSLNGQNVKLADLFSEIPKAEKPAYYTYQGSLTTPPFTESVNWVVAKRIFEASEEQIATIEKLEGNNARHVHALNSRKIEAQ